MAAREHRGQPGHAEALACEITLQQIQVPLVEVDGDLVGTELKVSLSKVKVCRDENSRVIKRPRGCQGALTSSDRAIVFAHDTERLSQEAIDASEATLVPHALCELSSVLERLERSVELPERVEGVAKFQAQ